MGIYSTWIFLEVWWFAGIIFSIAFSFFLKFTLILGITGTLRDIIDGSISITYNGKYCHHPLLRYSPPLSPFLFFRTSNLYQKKIALTPQAIALTAAAEAVVIGGKFWYVPLK